MNTTVIFSELKITTAALNTIAIIPIRYEISNSKLICLVTHVEMWL